MIKIQEHLNILDADAYLDNLAKDHWQSLNKRNNNGTDFKSNSLIVKCKKYRERTILKSYIKKYANNSSTVAQRHKAFFDFLLDSDAVELRRIIISRPSEFSAINSDIFTKIKTGDLYTGTIGNYSQTPFGSLLSENIFNYKAFRGSKFCKELFAKIGFQSTTCPYCNDNKLNIVKYKNTDSTDIKIQAYLDLDHFYPKSLHPYFAVSFFNLIPTCHDCNSIDKGNKPFTIETHIHPYYESFDDNYKFKISLKTLLGDPIDKIEILKISPKTLDVTLNDLKLNARYANNFEKANNLVNLFWKHKRHIGSEFENDFKELLLNDIPIEKHDILKHQRGKMNRDILKQVDINNVLNIL